MSRDKLKALGIDLPLFPVTAVGSYPKPDSLKKARTQFAKGEISREDLVRQEKEATSFWIRTQDELGVDVLVDGEMYRGDMVAYFAENFEGFRTGGLIRSYGNRYYRKPVIAGEVAWKGPITVEWWRYAQGLTRKTVKGMLTGPYTIMDWSFNEHYPDRRRTALALAREVRREVEALIAAGARIIQIDEPALSVRPEELPVAIEAMEAVTSGLNAYFVTHVCYGAFRNIYPGMLRMPVDNFDLEMSNSQLEFLRLFRKNAFTKDLTMGVVDAHSHVVEDAAAVQARIRRALKVIPRAALWVDPDCGLKTRETEEAIGKMRSIVQAAQALRFAA